MRKVRHEGVLFIFALMSAHALFGEVPGAAHATNGPGIIAIGSPLTFGGDNTPDTFSANTTFSSTPVQVDNGKVTIWQNQVPTGPNSEWDVFYLKTTSGGPIAGDVNAEWKIVMNYTLTAPVFFDQVVSQWQVNGTPVSPLNPNIGGSGGICCAALSNPILPGPAFYNSGFSGPIAAGTQTNWREIFASPYNIVSQGGINPNIANEFVFALHFTLQSALPTVSGAISASQFGAFPTFGPGSWIEIYGSNLGADTEEWTGSDFNGVNAPTKLGQTSVTIAGQSAFVDYISAGQVNVQVPTGVPAGSQPLIVTTEAGASAPFTVTVDAVQPGLLGPPSFNLGGTAYAVALFPDGVTYVLPPGAAFGVPAKRAKPGDVITLYGIGFGSVDKGIQPGQIAQQQSTLSAPFTVTIGGTQATVNYDGLAPNYVGLYQFNVVVPSIPPSDSAPVVFTLSGAAGTQKLALAIGN